MEWRIRVPRLTAGQVALLALVVLGAFMALDRTALHWYTLDTNAVAADVSTLQGENVNTSGRVATLETKVSSLQRTQQTAVSSALDISRDLELGRLANAIVVLSLVSNYGGQQSTTSPAGKACFAYLTTGQGSVTDCGFQHASP